MPTIGLPQRAPTPAALVAFGQGEVIALAVVRPAGRAPMRPWPPTAARPILFLLGTRKGLSLSLPVSNQEKDDPRKKFPV